MKEENPILVEFIFYGSNLTEKQIVSIIFDAILQVDKSITIGAVPNNNIHS